MSWQDYDKGVSYLALGSITAIPGYYAFGIFLLVQPPLATLLHLSSDRAGS